MFTLFLKKLLIIVINNLIVKNIDVPTLIITDHRNQ